MSWINVPEWSGICPKCTATGVAHYLTCPTLRVPPGLPQAAKYDTGKDETP
jgi:hypothetical protein